MPDPVAVASRLSGHPACVILEEFASFGNRRNTTTATASTSAGHTVHVSFELVDPPRVSRWFVHCPGLKEKVGFNGSPQILNAADALVVMRMAFFSNSGRVIDYFVYRAGPGKTSLDLIPGPCPEVLFPKQVGILPRIGGVGHCEHYSVVIPVLRLDPHFKYEIFVFSSESRAWSSKVAKFSQDQETTYDEVVLHSPTKAIAAGCGSLAWIDLWRGVLICTWIDEQPLLRLIQWPVPPARDVCIDMFSPLEVRDATLSNGVIRFVELKLRHNGGYSYFSEDAADHGWTATIWKRETSSTSWNTWLSADTSKIFAADSSSSHLLQKLWGDGMNKQVINVVSASPRLSLQNEDVVYIMASHNSCDLKAVLLAVNAREERLEAVEEEQIPLRLRCFPCTFSRFLGVGPGADRDHQSMNSVRREKENLDPLAFDAMQVRLARDQLMKLEEYLANNRPRYHRFRSIYNSGPAARLNVNTQLDRYAKSKSLCQASSKAMSKYIRAVSDIDLLALQGDLSAHSAAMRGKISVALGALDNLLQNMPETALECGREPLHLRL